MEPTVDKLSEDMERIHREQEELRKSCLALREEELLSLRQQVNTIESNLKLVRQVGYAFVSIVIFVLGFIGIKSLPEIENSINTKMTAAIANGEKRIEVAIAAAQKNIEAAWAENLKNRTGELLRLHDELQAVIALYKVEGTRPKALEALHKLAEQRPTSEIVFDYYTDVLLENGDYYSAIKYLDGLKKEKTFPGNFQYSTSFCNAGFISWFKFLSLPESSAASEAARDAQEWLEKAHDIAKNRKILQSDIRVPLYRLIFLHMSTDQLWHAKTCGNKYRKLGGKPDVSADTTTEWFRLLERKRSEVRKELEEIFPGCFSKAKPEGESRQQTLMQH